MDRALLADFLRARREALQPEVFTATPGFPSHEKLQRLTERADEEFPDTNRPSSVTLLVVRRR